MLQLFNIRKSYTTADFTQVALNDVSIAFRDNEFVAVLGASGSGKTTMLNIIGGLDNYDSGNLVIDGISTDQYTDRDWDTYRNNRIGFVFQSYNLIPHQSVLVNVELALTLTGVSRTERKERAKQALEEVGLIDHIHKKPSQLSGGQMQRVAIARALINDPEILLADEPTGALDSTTSLQIMSLLTKIASDRLVVMVTHNPDLAEQYANRIVNLVDGQVADDSNPFHPTAEDVHASEKPVKRTAMSFLTAMALSFNNLLTKKGRTLMTAFAGSIGIIGIAAILALAAGVNAYIKSVEEDTLSVYPLSILSQGFDFTALLVASTEMSDEVSADQTAVEGEGEKDEVHEILMLSRLFSSIGSNDLAGLKKYFDETGVLDEYVTSIEYSYDIIPQIYDPNTQDRVRRVNPDTTFNSLGFASDIGESNPFASSMMPGVFQEMVSDTSIIETQYDVVAGKWAEKPDELVVVLTPGGGFSDLTAFTMGLRDPAQLDSMLKQLANNKDIDAPSEAQSFSYDEILDVTFKRVNSTDFYEYDEEFGVWVDKSGDEKFLRPLVEDGQEMKIVGIVQPSPEAKVAALQPGIYYTRALTDQIIEQSSKAEITKAQLADPTVNVFTGRSFADEALNPEGGEFDLMSLVNIDADAITNAFKFDASTLSLDLDALNLSMPNLQIDPSMMPELDLSSFGAGIDLGSLGDLGGFDLGSIDLSGIDFGDLEIGINTEVAAEVAIDLVRGYLEFALANMDTSALMDSFTQFLQTPEAQQIIADFGNNVSPDADAIRALANALLDGFADFNAGMPDPTDLGNNFQQYLQSDEAQAIIDEVILELTPDMDAVAAEIAKLADDLFREYLVYVGENGVPGLSPEDLEASFQAFLETPEGKALFARIGDAIILPDMSKIGEQIGAQIGTQVEKQLKDALQNQMGPQLQTQLQNALTGYMQQVMGAFSQQIGNQISSMLQGQISQSIDLATGQLTNNMQNAMGIDEAAFMDAFNFNLDEEELSQLLMTTLATQTASFDGNLRKLGFADFDRPASIDIFPIDFEAKNAVLEILDGYNADMVEAGQEDKAITYTDIVGTLMSSVTDIINVISYVLVAFVSISLVVSSIMIGVITYISVLERKKEIGILRSIGASKRDIRWVFNAETLLVGFIAGLLGVVITYLLTLPVNAIVYNKWAIAGVAQLPLVAAIALVIISMFLTFLAGLIPSSAAARKDPVEALRSE